MNAQQKIENCKCGAEPLKPQQIKGCKGRYVIKCSNEKCPALVQRAGKGNCILAWNEMSTRLTT